jgi:hypothetical protein
MTPDEMAIAEWENEGGFVDNEYDSPKTVRKVRGYAIRHEGEPYGMRDSKATDEFAAND